MWTDEDIRFLGVNYGKMTHQELSDHLNKKLWETKSKIKELGLKEQMQKEYAVYFGDRFAYTGGKEEIMRDLKISEKSFWYLSTPSNAKRMTDVNGTMIVNLGMWPIDEEKYWRVICG